MPSQRQRSVLGTAVTRSQSRRGRHGARRSLDEREPHDGEEEFMVSASQLFSGVHGHEIVRAGGQGMSPLVATQSPHPRRLIRPTESVSLLPACVLRACGMTLQR